MYIKTKRFQLHTGGIGIGTILAVLVSWSLNKSILWAVVHGVCGWFYLAYVLFFHR